MTPAELPATGAARAADSSAPRCAACDSTSNQPIFGGRLRYLVSGGAPLPTEINRFCAAAEVPIVEGYGLTEAGTVTATGPDDDFETIATTVGRVRPGLEVCIAGDDGAVAAGGL